LKKEYRISNIIYSIYVEKDFHSIVLMDRASWHTTEALNIPANISILPFLIYPPKILFAFGQCWM